MFQRDNLNFNTCANTDGWGNKLVTIFARYLDSFIVTIKFSIIYQNRDFGSGQILPQRLFRHSPGFAKIAPYPPCTVTALWLKYRDRDRMLRRVTFTPSTAGPLGKILDNRLNDNEIIISVRLVEQQNSVSSFVA
jgi:hypothetical protein